MLNFPHDPAQGQYLQAILGYRAADQSGADRGSCRMVYNLALEQRRDWWRRYKAITGKSISYNMQSTELSALKRQVEWLRKAPSQVLQQALRDLDRTYQNFFLSITGYPTPRHKGLDDSFRFPYPTSLHIERTGKKSGRIKLLKLGWVAFLGEYDLPGAIRNITLSRWMPGSGSHRSSGNARPKSHLPRLSMQSGSIRV